MHSLIIGFGEIGQAVFEVLIPYDKISTYDINQQNGRTGRVDIMHVCFPYKEDFIKQVQEYSVHYEPKFTIVWSTVPIGTCKKLGVGIAHSPIEGRHPKLAESIRLTPRWVGVNNRQDRTFVKNYFESLSLEVKVLNRTNFTEALKLLSTSKYGINLVWADYEKQVADKLGMEYQFVKDFTKDYNDLYKKLGMDQFQKYVLDAPGGKIGGHCVVPNAELLNEQFPDPMLKMIVGMR